MPSTQTSTKILTRTLLLAEKAPSRHNMSDFTVVVEVEVCPVLAVEVVAVLLAAYHEVLLFRVLRIQRSFLPSTAVCLVTQGRLRLIEAKTQDTLNGEKT